MDGYFITGTDTEVGKTYFTTLLLRRLAQSRGAHARIAGFKPFCAGDRDDAEALAAHSQPPLTVDEVNPCWFALAAAPLVGARQEAFPLQMESVWEAWEKLCTHRDIIIAEGAGGWLTPLLPGMTIADLAKALELPVVVVATNRLGALNHTMLTVERILADGLTCAGVILNNVPGQAPRGPREVEEAPARDTNAAILREILPDGVPLLAELAADQAELPADFPLG